MNYTVLDRRRMPLVAAFLFAMACCNGVTAFRLLPYLRSGYQDFTIYYTAAKLISEGKPLYDLDAQYQAQLQFTNVLNRRRPLPFNHPPFEAFVFAPFARLSYWHAYLVWLALSLAMLATSAETLRRLAEVRDIPRWLVSLGCVAFFPAAFTLIQGQDSMLLLLLLTLSLAALARGSDVTAGAWMAAGLFRPHLVLPMALLLTARRVRIIFGFVAVAVALGVGWVMIAGFAGPIAYVKFVLATERSGAGGFGPGAVPNLRGIVYTLLGSRPATNIAPILTLLLSLLVFALALHRIRSGNDSIIHSFCLATLVAILISFHALVHDLTILLPLIILMFAVWFPRRSSHDQHGRSALLFLFWFSPLYVVLLFRANDFFLFGLVVLWLFVRSLRMPAPAADPT